MTSLFSYFFFDFFFQAQIVDEYYRYTETPPEHCLKTTSPDLAGLQVRIHGNLTYYCVNMDLRLYHMLHTSCIKFKFLVFLAFMQHCILEDLGKLARCFGFRADDGL